MGIEFEKIALSDICDRLSSGKSIKAKDIKEEGIYPVFGGNGLRGYTDKSNFKGQCAIIGRQGAYCGNVRYFSGEAYMTEHAVVCTSSKHNVRFLAHVLSNMDLGRLSGQSAQPGLSVKVLGQQMIDMPSRINQDKIAYYIDLFDKKIDVNKKIVTNLYQQLETLFKAFFIDCNHQELSSVKDWVKCSVGDVVMPIREKVRDRGYRVLSAVNTGKLQLSEDYFSKQVFSKDTSNYIVVQENDFAYNPARINIGSIGINDLGFVGCVSPVYVVFRTEKEYEYYFNMLIKTPVFQEEIKLRASGSVRQTLNFDSFSMIPIDYPSIEDVRSFNRYYSKYISLIKSKLKENEALEETKNSVIKGFLEGNKNLEDFLN